MAEGRVLPGGREGAGVGGLVSAFVILASIRCTRGYKSLNFIICKMSTAWRLFLPGILIVLVLFLEGWVAVP